MTETYCPEATLSRNTNENCMLQRDKETKLDSNLLNFAKPLY